MVTHTYPSILEDLQQLDQLQTIEKVEIQEILKDITTLQEGINLVKNQSSLKPFCDEDLYGMRWMCVLSRFPQKVGPKVGEMSNRFEVLRSMQSRVKDAFRDLLAWFGESEKDYTEIRSKLKRFREIRENPHFNALQIKFSYAVTCHKAQGGQWRAVFVDRCLFGEEPMTRDLLRWLYTALTRATERLYLVNFDKSFYE